MFRSLMLKKSLLRFQFSKFIINEQNFQSFKNNFIQKPQMSTFGQYFSYENALPLFSIITQAKQLQKAQRIALLNELEAICENDSSEKANSDEGLNLLANIHFHKSLQLKNMGNFQLVIKQLQAAIAIIQIMEYPDYFFLGELQRGKGEAYLRLNQLSKSQKALLKAENYLKQMLDDFLEQQLDPNIPKQTKTAMKAEINKTRSALAHTLTQLANTYLKESKIYECKSEMQKSLQIWQSVPNYKGIPIYQLTIRLKCLTHVIFNQKNEAIQSSNQLLEYLEDPKSQKLYRNLFELNLARLWHMNFVVSNFKEQNNSHDYLLAIKQKWQKKLLPLIKQSKKNFSPFQFESIMKSTGLTQQKLAKYGLI